MSAQKSKKGLPCLVSFLVFISILWFIVSCSSDSTKDEPGPSEQQNVSSSTDESRSSSSSIVAGSSSSVAGSSSSRARSSSSVAGSSSSRAGSSSSVAGSSSSRAGSSSSITTGGSSSSVAASSSSAGGGSKTCSATRSKTTYQYIPDGTSGLNKERHVLDLTLPDGNGPFPLVIFLHGGGFSGGSKNDSPGASGQAIKNGYALASIGYRLSGATKFPGSFNDILTAIRYLRANAEKYCLDPDKFVVTGFSAGAYHSGMVCVLSGYEGHDLDGWSDLYKGYSNKVQACATYAALTDMAYLVEDEKANPNITNWMVKDHGGSSPESVFLGTNQAIKDLPETQGSLRWRANPLNYVTANTPPIYMIHATNDNVVPWQQSPRLVDKIKEVQKENSKATFDKQTSGGHSGFDGRATQVFDFFKANLK